MATTLTPNKKDRFFQKNKIGSSSNSDSRSLGGGNTVSDSRVMRHNKRKSQKSSKDYSTRPKNSQNIFNIRHATNRADNDIHRIRSVSSHIIISPPFFINENKKLNRTTEERSREKNSGKILVTKRKSAVHNRVQTDDSTSRKSKKIALSESNKRSRYFENASNSTEKPKTRLKSLLDFGKKENINVLFPHIPRRQEIFPVASSETLDLNNTKYRRKHFNYLKEFDLIRYNSISKDLAELSESEVIFSLLPKISPSEPIALPRKKYSHGVLSIKDSKEVSLESEGDDEKYLSDTTMKVEFENTDVGRSREETTAKCCLGDNKCLNDIFFANDKDYVLVVKKPIRIKCIDEASNKIRDILVYSEEYLENIVKEKGNSISKKEIYESLLKESTDYTGKSLRIIVDAEKYSRSFHSNRRYQGDIKQTSTKIPKRTLSRASKSVMQTKKRSSKIPSCNRNSTALPVSDQTQKEAQSEANTPLTKHISNDTVGIESVVITLTETDPEDSNKSKSMEILIRENKKFKSRNETKSRTALKSINIESIVASSFRYYFQFHAKLGRSLKSGAAISKTNSTSWLKKSGIVYDSATKNLAEKCFMTVACAKYVLNICDYIKCLNRIAMDRRMLLVEILYRMMSVDLHSVKKSGAKQKTDQPKDPIAQDSTLKQNQGKREKPKKDTKHR